MVNILEKVNIGDTSGQKASKEKILAWKTSLALLEAKTKLWKPFAIAVIEMIFDLTITTTSRTGDDIDTYMQARTIKIIQINNENKPFDQQLEDCSNINSDSNTFFDFDNNYFCSLSPSTSSEYSVVLVSS
ncbi:8151_t:CDS:2, partial [Racocetra persica]